MDILHDSVELCVNFLCRPFLTDRVLGHLKARSSHAAGIGSLARSIEKTCALEGHDSLRSRRHIGTLSHAEASIGNKFLRLLAIDFVLGSTWKGNVALHAPRPLSCVILRIRIFLRIFPDTSPEDILQEEYVLHLLLVESVRVIYESVAV